MTTTDLSLFGSREWLLLTEILQAWKEQGLPSDFCEDEVIPMFNLDSGYVFLTNSDFQCAFMNGCKLERWYNSGNCGHEGFYEECQFCDEGCNECMRQETFEENTGGV